MDLDGDWRGDKEGRRGRRGWDRAKRERKQLTV
jgi:hypothetical protein